MSLDDLMRAASARVEAVRVVSSALNPLLWLTGIISPLSLALAVWTNDVFLRDALFVLACFPVLVTIITYCVFMIRDPDRLQSEEYRLRRDALLMFYKRGASPETLKVTSDLARLEDLIDDGRKGEIE